MSYLENSRFFLVRVQCSGWQSPDASLFKKLLIFKGVFVSLICISKLIEGQVLFHLNMAALPNSEIGKSQGAQENLIPLVAPIH